jgi:hypothetical protein
MGVGLPTDDFDHGHDHVFANCILNSVRFIMVGSYIIRLFVEFIHITIASRIMPHMAYLALWSKPTRAELVQHKNNNNKVHFSVNYPY